MIDLLGLPSLRVLGISETASDIVIEVTAIEAPRCKSHPTAKLHGDGEFYELEPIRDLPMRGKAVSLRVQVRPLRCSVCERNVYQRSPDFDPSPQRGWTRRLVSYVEDALLRDTIVEISRDTGLSERQIGPIAQKLATKLEALKDRRSVTPDIVAMDGVHVAQGKQYQVVTDGRTGLPIAIFEGLSSETVLAELPSVLDMNAVRVLVTDMDPAYKKIKRHMPNATHVADKFHVIDKVNSAVYGVVSDQCAALKAAGKHQAERALRALRPALAGRRTPAQKADAQYELDFEKLPNRISQYQAVNDAHRARWQILYFYRSTAKREAAKELDEFMRRAKVETIMGRMADAVKYITNGRGRILNFFDHVELRENGVLWGPTTSPAERRNGNLQELWARSRGHSHAPHFWLKAMFHPYRLGGHIIECGDCGKMEGPLPLLDAVALSRLVGPVVMPQDRRCSACANKQSPPAPMEHDGDLGQAA